MMAVGSLHQCLDTFQKFVNLGATNILTIPLYRYKVLTGDVALRVRELVRQTCEAFEIRILSGVVSQDHVHLFLSAPPSMAPSEFMRRLKGRSASKLFEEFPVIK